MQSFAIIIEWENARFAELQRTRAMLGCLRGQLAALGARRKFAAEVIFLFNRRDIPQDLVETTVAECFPSSQVPARVRIVSTDGFNYYQQKNHGVTLTDAEIVVLLDCDIVPEEGWLEAILEPFADPGVQVVAGATYVELGSVYSRAFALFWFFALRDPSDGMEPTWQFHANNAALRRDFFARNPFPEFDGYRAAGDLLMQSLRERGITIHLQKKARAKHPVPIGVWYFAARAMHNGRDYYLRRKAIRLHNHDAPVREAFWGYRADLAALGESLRKRRHAVGLGQLGAVWARAVGFAYTSLKFAGYLLAHYVPGFLPRFFKI